MCVISQHSEINNCCVLKTFRIKYLCVEVNQLKTPKLIFDFFQAENRSYYLPLTRDVTETVKVYSHLMLV